jgi:hypothetical protein
MAEAERALERVHMECDAAHERAGVIKQDFRARLCASVAGRQRSLEFDQILSRHRFILFVQGMDLERREEVLADDQARGLYSPDGRDLPSELGKIHEHMAEVEDDHASGANQLSQSTMEISNAFVDWNVLPIQSIPLHPWSVNDVMATFCLFLEWLCEEVPVREPDA